MSEESAAVIKSATRGKGFVSGSHIEKGVIAEEGVLTFPSSYGTSSVSEMHL
jgi:hypothetical protein